MTDQDKNFFLEPPRSPSSKYIPKSKLAQVQQLDDDKVPVREILELLGKGRK